MPYNKGVQGTPMATPWEFRDTMDSRILKSSDAMHGSHIPKSPGVYYGMKRPRTKSLRFAQGKQRSV